MSKEVQEEEVQEFEEEEAEEISDEIAKLEDGEEEEEQGRELFADDLDLETPADSIPLIDIPKAPTIEGQLEEKKRKQEEEIASRMSEAESIERRMMEEQLIREELKKQTPAMKAGKIAGEIAKQTAEEMREIAKKKIQSTPNEKQEKEAKKMFENLTEEETIRKHRSNVKIMNDYKLKYEGKIPYQFEREYTMKMKPEYVSQCREEVSKILNTMHVPTFLGHLLIFGCNFGESLIESLNFPILQPLIGVSKDIEECLDKGFFDDELEQLAIEMQDYFACGPSGRLFYKILMICVGRYKAFNKLKMNEQNLNNKKFQNQTKDL